MFVGKNGQKIMDLNKYYNKKILIVGGGSSTLDVKWENITHDYLWTCNDFYLEDRVVSQEIDLYLLAFTTDLNHYNLHKKLQDSSTTVFYEPIHYRRKENEVQFLNFEKKIGYKVKRYSTPKIEGYEGPGLKSGAMFRLILLALATEASDIYFVGFDGFNKDFSNIHAFSKHKGLKKTDLRRTWKGGPDAYYEIFTDAYQVLAQLDTDNRLQNLGEGFDYNIGTHVSKEHFPLRKELYEKLR